MYDKIKSIGDRKIIFVAVAIIITGIIITVILSIIRKAEQAGATIQNQDDSTENILDGVYRK